MTDGWIMDTVQAFFEEIDSHQDHTWKQVGRCVYCADCKVRLYQGKIPDHKKVKR